MKKSIVYMLLGATIYKVASEYMVNKMQIARNIKRFKNNMFAFCNKKV